MSDLAHIGDNIRHYRQVRGLSMAALVRKSGIGRSTLTKLEAGDCAGLRHSTVQAIARALDVPMDWVVTKKRPELPTHVRWELVDPFEYDGCVWD